MKYDIKELVRQLPPDPGVYRYYNEYDELIYVGKAKNLKNRVSSYFNKSNQHNRKTKRLVSQIRNIKYTIVNSEYDALLLENSFIKKYQPRYNINLKDDKTYPYICIVNERFPRVISTRNLDKKKGEFFGPYGSVRAINNLLDLFHKLFQLRTCSLNLSEENVQSGKYEVCLEYHIGNCQGPCVAHIAEKDYNNKIDQIRNILKGNLAPAKEYYKSKMLEYSEQFEFEKAGDLKAKLDLLQSFEERSVVSNPKVSEVDVFTLVDEDQTCYINFFKVQNGIITASKNIVIKKQLEETNEDILLTVISLVREELKSNAKEVLSNLEIDFSDEIFTVIVPKIGDKKKLIELSKKNALTKKIAKTTATKPDRTLRLLEQVKKDLRLIELPKHIECFDNSNIQGSNPVASMVCFKMAKPSKKDYRHYNIKTVDGPNDFDSMHEIVYRRYKRLIEEGKPLPQLVLIDGGKGQLSAAVRALKDLQLYEKIPLIGIAKRLEELYYPEDSIPLLLGKKSETLNLLQRLRNEAHRFAITFHRNKRSGAFIKTELEEIPGIGPSTIKNLLIHFKTASAVFKASDTELESIIGTAKTKKIREYQAKKKEV